MIIVYDEWLHDNGTYFEDLDVANSWIDNIVSELEQRDLDEDEQIQERYRDRFVVTYFDERTDSLVTNYDKDRFGIL